MPTLVILDVQDPYLADLADGEKAGVVEAISHQIVTARERNDGIIITQYNVKEEGETSHFVQALIEGYDKVVSFEKDVLDAGDQVIAVTHQRSFGTNPIRLCGLFGDGALKQTALRILYLTNYQTTVEIAEAACGCIDYFFSDSDCLRWIDDTSIQIV